MSDKWKHYFGSKEWEIILRLCASFSDPEQKKSFVYSCREKKEADPFYSILNDFPEMAGEETKVEIARRECIEAVRKLGKGF